MVVCTGRDRVAVKRKAVRCWAANGDRLGLTLKAFIARCRIDPGGRIIVFR